MIGRGPRKEILEKGLSRIIDKIDKTNIQKIILFGSLAKGNVGLNSDIDLIIIKNTKQRFLQRLESIYQEMEPDIAVDVLVYTPEEIKDLSQWNSFIKQVIREGKVLYQRYGEMEGKEV